MPKIAIFIAGLLAGLVVAVLAVNLQAMLSKAVPDASIGAPPAKIHAAERGPLSLDASERDDLLAAVRLRGRPDSDYFDLVHCIDKTVSNGELLPADIVTIVKYNLPNYQYLNTRALCSIIEVSPIYANLGAISLKTAMYELLHDFGGYPGALELNSKISFLTSDELTQLRLFIEKGKDDAFYEKMTARLRARFNLDGAK